ncbi:MAG: type II CRISPR-associated endonuclease Cas1 [Chloroflexi bacterium]|nr:type II CRISPR-associated endonuclease Cas1 [Chloroflexota bacterium]
MTDYIIDISEEAVGLKASNNLLVIEKEDGKKKTYPFDEVAALIVSHPRVYLTHHVLSRLAEAGGIFIVCNEKHMPSGMILPLSGNYAQTERFGIQASASLPLKKQCWSQVVRAKVRAQAKLLDKLHGDDRGLSMLVSRIKSGDTTNIEGQASRRYWPALFCDPSFRRNRNGEDQNRHLNYGYAVLRAIIGRAVTAAGLHPSLGIHHHNRYDPFCLADDLMEPFRPLVDEAVVKWVADNDPLKPLDKESKAAIISPLTRRFTLDGEERSLFDIANRTALSLVFIFSGLGKKLLFPEL